MTDGDNDTLWDIEVVQSCFAKHFHMIKKGANVGMVKRGEERVRIIRVVAPMEHLPGGDFQTHYRTSPEPA